MTEGWRRGSLKQGLAFVPLLAALALAGCGDGGEASPSAARPGGAAGAGTGGRGPGGDRVVPVEVAVVEEGPISRSLAVSGIVEPIRSVGVNSQLAGALLSVNTEEGDFVRQGAVLARLDDRELRAELASAEASHDVAEGTYRRAEQLRESQVITLAEYERDRAAYEAAKARRDQLRTRLGYATIRAPVAGVVTEKRVETGDVVSPQTRLFTVADIEPMVVRVPVSELDVVEISPGETVEVALDAFPGRRFEGRVRRVFPAADPETRLVPVEVVLEGESARLARPGFLARVMFSLGARERALLVPAAAVVGEPGSEAVFVVESGTAKRRAVTTGLTTGGRVEVVSGLALGDRVVVTGNNALRDGAAVRPVNDPAGAPAGQRVRETPPAPARAGGGAG